MKKHTLFLAKQLFAGLLSTILLAGSTTSYGQVLLAGTDFNPLPGKESKPYLGIEDVKWYGLVKPKAMVAASLTPYTNAGVFDLASHYAITDNPSKLDKVRFKDITASSDYQIILSVTNSGIYSIDLLSLILPAIKSYTDVEVRISYCSPIDTSIIKCGRGEVLFAPTSINSYSYYIPNLTMGQCSTYSIKGKSSAAPLSVSFTDVEFKLQTYSSSGNCKVIAISKIEVFGTPKPILKLSDEYKGCTGDLLSLETDEYQGSTYQWQIFENQTWTNIPNAIQKSLYYKTSTPKLHAFRVGVTVPDGSLFYSDSLALNVADCCGGPTTGSTLQTIFKDDFGKVDLSDKTGKTYKVWDYLTDPLNPIEVTKATTTPFRWPINPAPLGAAFVGATGVYPARQAMPIEDGYYTVASYITSYNPYGGYDGALLGWAGYVTGPQLAPTISYDHSGKLEGAALFINCPPNSINQTLYSRIINTACSAGKPILFECWIAVFTQSASGPYNNVNVNVKMTDINDPTNTVIVNGKATREAEGGGKWVKIAGQITLTGNAVRMDLINNQNVSVNGNDLVIDDIKIMVCSTPQPESFFNATSLSKTDTLCDEPFQLELLENESLTNYYNNQPYFLYQYSKTPADLSSWKNLGTPSSQSKAEIVGSTLVGVSNGDKVYFRTVVADAVTFTTKNNFQGTGNYANGNDACKNYSVSAPISALWTNSVKCSFSTHIPSSQETEWFHAYPNPVKDLLIVGEETVSAQLYNTMGQLVLQSNTSQLQVGHLQAGLYQVTVRLKNGKKVTQKIVKE